MTGSNLTSVGILELFKIIVLQTVQKTKELKRLLIDIAALLQTRQPEEDELTSQSFGYKFIWVGKSKGERYEGFSVKTALTKYLKFPSSVNDRKMKLRIQLQNGQYASLFSLHLNLPGW